MHRIASVRESQGVTLRTISRRSGIPVRQLKAEESGKVDLTLSQLYRWAAALEVPPTELLSEPQDCLAANVDQRARMVRLMKSVQGLRAHAESTAMRRIADRLRDELLEIIPELDEITAWPKEAPRTPGRTMGRVFDLPVSMEPFERSGDSLL